MSASNTIPLPGSHLIPLHYAIQLTSRYRNNRELVLDPDWKSKDILPLSETFNKEDIADLMAQSGAAGIRIYPGMDQVNQVHIVIVAVNAQNEDIVSSNASLSNSDIIVQEGQLSCHLSSGFPAKFLKTNFLPGNAGQEILLYSIYSKKMEGKML